MTIFISNHLSLKKINKVSTISFCFKKAFTEYQKLFAWKFLATSRGNAKSVVRTRTFSKGKIVVQNAKDFAEVGKK